MEERVLLISPVRDEIGHVDAVVAGVAGQSRPPALWLVVDDGSRDGTRERFEEHAKELPCLVVVATPPGYTPDAGDRLGAAAPDRAWNYGLKQVGLDGFTHLGKLDGDVVLPPGFLEALVGYFDGDPGLGMAGGRLVEEHDGEWRPLTAAPGFVSGACRLYSRECFGAIGGMPERLGSDGITVAYARMRGFRTATLAEPPARHLRAHGSAQGTLQGCARRGRYLYVLHYYALWAVLRAALAALREPPYLASGAWMLGGYLSAALRREPQVEDPELRAFVRAELRDRITRRWRRRAPDSLSAQPSEG